MRSLLCRGLLILVPLVAAAAGRDDHSPDRQHIEKLIKLLGHDQYSQREIATEQLKSFGEPALPILRRAAATSTSQEVRNRAQTVVRDILLGTRKSPSTGMTFAVINASEYEMGSLSRRRRFRTDEFLHRVRLTRTILIGTHEVTQETYERVMKVNPSYFAKQGGGKEKVKDLETGRFPVENLSWFDAIDFCNRLSKLDGYELYYKLADVKREGDAITQATVTILATNGYRLPTEAEWEFACRAGTTTDFHFGRTLADNQANLRNTYSKGYQVPDADRFLERTESVGSYKPNDWGLYDMHGNAAEWCADWFDDAYYLQSPPKDPTGPDQGRYRAVRGGSWRSNSTAARSASRSSESPCERSETIGFRVARTP